MKWGKKAAARARARRVMSGCRIIRARRGRSIDDAVRVSFSRGVSVKNSYFTRFLGYVDGVEWFFFSGANER